LGEGHIGLFVFFNLSVATFCQFNLSLETDDFGFEVSVLSTNVSYVVKQLLLISLDSLMLGIRSYFIRQITVVVLRVLG
jgi:hypothetical protein